MNEKFLKGLIVVLVVVSLATQFSALFILSSSHQMTGKATLTTNGNVSIGIASILAISLDNSTVDFGACVINESQSYIVLDSSLNASEGDNSVCSGTFPSFLSIKNVGTLRANISIKTNYSSVEFFNNAPSWYGFKVINSEDYGCHGTAQNSYKNFSSTDSFLVCDNTSWFPGNNSLDIAIKAVIYPNTTTKRSSSITFEAQESD
ncbi:MAG: hypothetical protein ACQESC_00250 [Nanobdellota archaeon]